MDGRSGSDFAGEGGVNRYIVIHMRCFLGMVLPVFAESLAAVPRRRVVFGLDGLTWLVGWRRAADAWW